ncbi:sugar kinase [Roseiterribacter gracilis]|uniref:2-keto-3-deoxygluconate kinase n=1 Tax=Roseiterribacter gracilis TaxID=2812848 RepID=A0A8S8XCP5_9PROT|nr:2-keto-3-deoxygluconate kinase [Rhodospirillales bacterium TMPK1]
MTARVVCFGEILIRLSSPDNELLLQSPNLRIHYGGAEANVAVSLARFGHDAAMVSFLPDNALGRAAMDELRRYGVDTRFVTTAPGRMGLYFLAPGAVLRPSEIVYDRAHSSFATGPIDTIKWDETLAGAGWLHVSGVTPALGSVPAAAAVRAAQTARKLGVQVSFDGNYRAKLWGAWQGDGPGILRTMLTNASIAFADDRDIALVLGRPFNEADPAARRRAAAKAAFDAFPNLQRITSTIRTQHGVEHHDMSAVLFTRTSEFATASFSLAGIVDRIGAGDAFAAGVLHGLASAQDDETSLNFGLAAACLKHSIPGDFNLASESDVHAFLGGGLDVRR